MKANDLRLTLAANIASQLVFGWLPAWAHTFKSKTRLTGSLLKEMPFESFPVCARTRQHSYVSTLLYVCLCTQKGLGDSELWQPPSEGSGEGWIERGRRDGDQKMQLKERKTDQTPFTQHFHWLSTPLWMWLTPKSLAAFFKIHLHLRETFLPCPSDVVLVNCLRDTQITVCYGAPAEECAAAEYQSQAARTSGNTLLCWKMTKFFFFF